MMQPKPEFKTYTSCALAIGCEKKAAGMTFENWMKVKGLIIGSKRLPCSLHPIDEFGHAFFAVMMVETEPGKFMELPSWAYYLAGFTHKRMIHPLDSPLPVVTSILDRHADMLFERMRIVRNPAGLPNAAILSAASAYKIWGKLLQEF